jgi:suppressor of G2 allele of SKP1
MSTDLTARIESSRQAALAKGTVIKLRKEDILKTKILGDSQKFEYTWYQTPTKVGIEIPYSVEDKYKLNVTFQDDRVVVDFPLPKGKGQYHLDLTLFKKINRVKSTHFLRLDNLEIVMEKKTQETWKFLRRDGLGIAEGESKTQLSYPSSSKVRHNWDKFDKEIGNDMMEHYEDYGLDAGSALFQQIYANGDEEKRRAMIKSFQTSNGTCLSTDWQDVSKKDYEGKDRLEAPKGQEWRKSEL